MTAEEANNIFNDWLAYGDRQRAKAQRLTELAALARKGPEEAKQAQAELRRIDCHPTVYDAGRLRPAVIYIQAEIERLTDENERLTEQYNVERAHGDENFAARRKLWDEVDRLKAEKEQQQARLDEILGVANAALGKALASRA